MDPLLCDQFQLLAVNEVRNILVYRQYHPDAINLLLDKLGAITESRAPGGIEGYTAYLEEILCSQEHSWYYKVSYGVLAFDTLEIKSRYSNMTSRLSRLPCCHYTFQATSPQRRLSGYYYTFVISMIPSNTPTTMLLSTATSASRRG